MALSPSSSRLDPASISEPVSISAADPPLTVAASSGGTRLRLGSVFAASPSDPPVGGVDIMVVDTGAAQVLRVRYNDAGAMRVGDVALV